MDQPYFLREGSFLSEHVDRFPLIESQVLAQEPVIVIAPHPDDETLGCGGAIALLRHQKLKVNVLVVSDGTLSHPNSKKFPAPKLKTIREQETLAALDILGVSSQGVTFLGLKDGSVPVANQSMFGVALTEIQRYLKNTEPRTIFIPWRFDPHSDHRAVWQLIKHALSCLGSAVRCIEYPIWDWDIQQQKQISDVNSILGWRLNIEAVLPEKQRAISCYRSQLGQVIDDDPEGFCLQDDLLRKFTSSYEIYFEEIL